MTSHFVHQVAPNYVHAVMPAPSSSASGAATAASPSDDSFTFTVGKLDAGMAILIGDRASLIEFPSLLLPPGVSSGSVVNIRVLRNLQEEKKQKAEFDQLQHDILHTFGTHAPQPPALRLRNVTQTSVTLEWDRLSLATASLLSLDIYRNGQRLAPIPNPLHNTSTKLSGLDVDADYTFHLVLKTTAGTFASPIIRTRTHTINDTSGISVCFGHVSDPDILAAAKEALTQMKARWSDRIQIDTSHFVCTDPRNPGDTNAAAAAKGQGNGYAKAMQLSIPVVKPHWIFACYDQKRMVNISPFYLDQDPPNAATLRESIAKLRGKTTAQQPPQQPPAQQQSRDKNGAADGAAAAASGAAAAAAVEAATAAAEAMDPKAPLADGAQSAATAHADEPTTQEEASQPYDAAPEAYAAVDEDEDIEGAHDLPPIPLSMTIGAAHEGIATETETEAETEAEIEADASFAAAPTRAAAAGIVDEQGTSNELGLDLHSSTAASDGAGAGAGGDEHDVSTSTSLHGGAGAGGLASPNPSIEVTAPDEDHSRPLGFEDEEGEEGEGIQHPTARRGTRTSTLTQSFERQVEDSEVAEEEEEGRSTTIIDPEVEDDEQDEGEMDTVSLGGL